MAVAWRNENIWRRDNMKAEETSAASVANEKQCGNVGRMKTAVANMTKEYIYLMCNAINRRKSFPGAASPRKRSFLPQT